MQTPSSLKDPDDDDRFLNDFHMQAQFTSPQDIYEVLSEYAKGGMGITYLVKSQKTGQKLILKELRMDKVQDWKAVELFDREVEVLRSLDHPNIPKYVDSIASEDKVNFAMIQSFIEGNTLQQLMTGNILLSNEQFTDYLCQCLDVLAYLHGRVPPVIHRDISPKNIIIGGDKAYIVDFGAVKSAMSPTSSFSTVVGTFGYMAQEQVMGRAVPGSDLYSLGMSFVAFALHREPEHLPLDEETGQLNIRELLELPDKLEAVLEGMTRLNLTERLCDARQAIRVLKAIPTAVATRQSLTSPYVEVGYKSTREITPIKLGKTSIKNELNLVNFIQQDERWYEVLIKDKAGYEILLMWVAQIQNLEAKLVFDRMIQTYKESGPEYVREAILRYFVPERPVEVNGRRFDLFGAQDVGEQCVAFFEILDDLWKQTDLQAVKLWMFQFEFSLRQLADVSADEMKAEVTEILERVAAQLGVELKNDFSDYRTSFHDGLTYDNLVMLFHAFNPERSFKDLANKTYDSIESVAFFFAGQKELLELGREEDRGEEGEDGTKTEKKRRKKKSEQGEPASTVEQSRGGIDARLHAEKNAFLRKHGMDALCELSYRELLFTVFRDHAKSDVQVRNIAYDDPEKGQCTIDFEIVGKSLTDYFYRHGLDTDLSDTTKKESLILPQKSYFRGASLYASFIRALEKQPGLKESMISATSKGVFKKMTAERFRKCLTRDAVSFGTSIGLLLPLLGSALFYSAYVGANADALAFLNSISPVEVKYLTPNQNPYGFRSGIVLLTLMFLIPAFVSFVVPVLKFVRNYWSDLGPFLFGPVAFLIGGVTTALVKPSIFAISAPIIIPILGFVVLLMNRLVRLIPFLCALGIFVVGGTAVLFQFSSTTAKVIIPEDAPVLYSASVIQLLGQGSELTLHSAPDPAAPKAGQVERGKRVDVIRDTMNWVIVRSEKAAGFLPKSQIRRLATKTATVKVKQSALYSQPSRNSEIVQELFEDASVALFEESSEWHLARRGSNEGYVHASDVEISSKETASVTVRTGKDCEWIRSEIVFYVDGTAHGRFRAGEGGLRVEVPVGEHVLQASCDEMNWGPQTLYIDIEGTDWNMGCQK